MVSLWALLTLLPLALCQSPDVITAVPEPGAPTPMPSASKIDPKNLNCLVAKQACETASLSLNSCNSQAVTRLATAVSTNVRKMVSCLCEPSVEFAFHNCMVVEGDNCLGSAGNASMMSMLWEKLSCSQVATLPGLMPNSSATLVSFAIIRD
jgi:hypothetical protein